MALWATLLMVITLLGMATVMLGLVVAVPWLAHASWHAYMRPCAPCGRGGKRLTDVRLHRRTDRQLSG
jgi:uncharacterized membrane protein